MVYAQPDRDLSPPPQGVLNSISTVRLTRIMQNPPTKPTCYISPKEAEQPPKKTAGANPAYFRLIAANTHAAPNPAMIPANGSGEADVCTGFTGDAVGCAGVGSGVASAIGVGSAVGCSQTDEP